MNPLLVRVSAFVLAGLLLAGCASEGISTDRSDKFVYATVGGVNHTDMYMDSVSINGASGGNMDAYGSTSGMCCVGVPRVYKPGMTVTVKWRARDKNNQVIRGSKVVEVEPYTEIGDVYAHIFPDDVVRVVVSVPGAHSSKHPIPYPIDPNIGKGEQQ
ncbi:DUF3304 domain-containing protein [Ralstonia edaphi]|uniref:DUF3304 domain-containing protein n=1 Tax=Ralstonia edaphi TaxID=3058599 RepID=UPI00292EBB08|nr:DUF3304 domain-containing protein [Ralstonia sp. LMG 6871]